MRATAVSISSSRQEASRDARHDRGAARPAASAARVMLGTTCVAITRSSAIQRIVPSVRSPATRSMTGPRTGVGVTSVMSRGLWTRNRSFSTSTGPGPLNARSNTSRYDSIVGAGRS